MNSEPRARSRAALLLLLAPLAACSGAPDSSHAPVEDVAQASARCSPPAPPDPAPPDADRAALVAGGTQFAIDLYRALAWRPENAGRSLFFSPYSISLALAMTYAGAGGETASQLASALHFTLPPARLHAAFGALDAELESRGADTPADRGHPFRLHVASSLWLQRTLAVEAPFLATLTDDYRSTLGEEDFAADPDGARVAIDRWVSDHTSGAIPQLFAPGSIQRDARFVIADAIDFDAAWALPFDPRQTAPGDFHGADGKVTTAPLMHQWAELPYADGDGWQAIAIPYDGHQLSLLVLLPSLGGLDDFEGRLDGARLAAITGSFQIAGVTLTLPKFRIDPGATSLRDRLRDLGMVDAFDGARADFSAITTSQRIAIGDVVHQAFIDVDENGTQAAAATGVVGVGLSVPSRTAVVTVDRPFVYAIRDDATGAILFLGRVTSL